MNVQRRNNVTVSGSGARTIVFSHGFGTDQSAWNRIVPAFEAKYGIVRFDHVGAGGSNSAAYDPDRYVSLRPYAQDLLDVLAEVDCGPAIFVGHSVASMIGLLAAIDAPGLFASLIMICPSPCYVDDLGYKGGFSRGDLDELLEVVDSNFLGWSRDAAPAIMRNPDRPELAVELDNSFCRTDPAIARQFARVTFLSDHRIDLPLCGTPTLVLQTQADMVAPDEVGSYIVGNMPRADLYRMKASGHCPHMSAPDETVDAIRRFIEV